MARTPSTMIPLGTEAPDFALPDVVSGRKVERADFADAPGFLVMFICNHCPYVIHLREGLSAFAAEYMERGLGVVAISSNDVDRYPQDGPGPMADEAREAGYPFPYLFDESQDVARSYGAACTPDFFLFDADGRLAYRGQFDGSRPGNDEPVTGADLRAAADGVLAGRLPNADQRPSVGCNIKWKPGREPAYFAD